VWFVSTTDPCEKAAHNTELCVIRVLVSGCGGMCSAAASVKKPALENQPMEISGSPSCCNMQSGQKISSVCVLQRVHMFIKERLLRWDVRDFNQEVFVI
jgi:hypothetical protein